MKNTPRLIWKFIPIWILVLLLIPQLSFSQNSAHELWKLKRSDELLAENGWLNLAGLLWISPQAAFLNEASQDSLFLSTEATKKNIGKFQFKNDSVWFSFHPKVMKKSKDQTPIETLQYPAENYTKGGVYFERWKWSVIKRADQYAVRLRDLKHPALEKFEPIPTYAYDSAWRVEAFFEPRFNQFISITNVLGQVIEWRVMGLLRISIHGKTSELITLEDEGKLFLIFSDDTNGNGTYPSGRYLYVPYPDKTGKTQVDFNFAYNPPCAFTAYATCPIPPKENRLDVAIIAGEKYPLISH
jgi:uncharacterized protein (DUF1684 family)